MKLTSMICSFLTSTSLSLLAIAAISGDELPATNSDAMTQDADSENRPATVAEARGRARILHESFHGVLQVMHRDFFDEEAGLAIPSKSLEDVFKELARSYDVKMRWLAVNTDAMSVDHNPRTEFEASAVKALASGKQEFESNENGLYQHAGAIRLSSRCLKCHLPNRTSTKDHTAALVITMPLRKP